MLEKIIYLFARTWLAYTSNHIIGSSDPRGASGRFRLGALQGNIFFIPMFSTKGVNFFLPFLLFFFTGLNFVFVPPRMERKTCRFGVM